MLYNTEIQEKEELENDVIDLHNTYADLKLKLERNELILSDHEPNIDMDELYSQIQNGKRETQEILYEIEIIEEKIAYKQGNIIKYSEKLANSRVEELKSLINVSSAENGKNLISVMFDKILLQTSKYKESKKNLKSKEIEIEEMNKVCNQLKFDNEIQKKLYEHELAKVENE